MKTLLAEKRKVLEERLRNLDGTCVAFSGGTDSTFLLAIAVKALPRDRVLAITAVSPSFPPHEKDEVLCLARLLDARHRFVRTREMDNPNYASNPMNRCFYCKDDLFRTLAPLAQALGLSVVDGFNISDRSDFRPGYEAARAWGVLHPLEEAALTKEDIRNLSRDLGLPNWDKPSSPCLSSRIPYGTPVTEEALGKIARSEAVLRSSGFRVVRVRHLGEEARVEVGSEELPRLFDPRLQKELAEKIRAAGYARVLFDPEPYRSGRLNEEARKALQTQGSASAELFRKAIRPSSHAPRAEGGEAPPTADRRDLRREDWHKRRRAKRLCTLTS